MRAVALGNRVGLELGRGYFVDSCKEKITLFQAVRESGGALAVLYVGVQSGI